MSMVVVLPKARSGLRSVEEDLTADALEAWLDTLTPTRVDLRLPKFSFSFEKGLSEVLREMGMTAVFSAESADLSGITGEERLFLGPVLHKAWVSVDEAGTEAAAATVGMLLKSEALPNPIEVVVDRPFLFLIRHRATGTILFLGRVTDPKQPGGAGIVRKRLVHRWLEVHRRIATQDLQLAQQFAPDENPDALVLNNILMTMLKKDIDTGPTTTTGDVDPDMTVEITVRTW